VRIDPRVAADGVTQKDLEEQLALNLKIRDAIQEARVAAQTIADVRKRALTQSPALQELEARLVTGPGAYPQPKLIDQLGNLSRMTGAADQKVGRDAFLRYDDLRKELDAILAEVKKLQ
jgi:hypothetical protein